MFDPEWGIGVLIDSRYGPARVVGCPRGGRWHCRQALESLSATRHPASGERRE
jgi:hypothetical protein